jgi:hypothetical protein
MTEHCIYCSETEEIRPYGPNGAWLCVNYMKADPEIEKEAYKNFCAALDAAGETAVIDGDKHGVRAYNKANIH